MELTITELQSKSKHELLQIAESVEFSDATRQNAAALIEETVPKQGRPKKQEAVGSDYLEEEVFWHYARARFTKDQISELKKLKRGSKAFDKRAAEFESLNLQSIPHVEGAFNIDSHYEPKADVAAEPVTAQSAATAEPLPEHVKELVLPLGTVVIQPSAPAQAYKPIPETISDVEHLLTLRAINAGIDRLIEE